VFYIILVLFVLVTGTMAILMLQNFSNEVQLSLLFWQLPHLPSGLLLFLSFLLGAGLLYIVSLASARREGRELKRLQKQVEELQQTSVKTPPGPLQGTPPIVPMPGMPPPALPTQPPQPPPQQ
jgi:uncharacterized integral membrane protein